MSVYESYVDIPLPWLSQMPSHWTLLRNKNFLKEVKETVGDASADYTLLSLTTKGIIPRDVASGKGKFPKDYDTYKVVKSGDIAFCLFDIDETPRTVGLSEYDGMLTGAYTVFHLNGINPHFFTYYYLALDNVKALRPLYSGLRKTIKTNVFLGTKFPVPPRKEQDQIVRHLDWQVSKTNKLIHAFKKQIALLKEQKQAVINEAVTKGLDPSVPMKDSGVEWIGEIPAKWRKDKIPRLFSSIGSGTTPASGNAKYYRDGTIPWINSGDLYTDKKRVESAGKSVNELALTDYSVLKLYQEAACVIAMYGASVGNAAIVDFPFCCNQACCVLSNPREDLLLDFIYYCTSAFKRHLIEKSRGGGQPNISQDMIRKVWIPLPDLEAQKKIVEYLSAHCQRIDDLIENINHEIALLGEYRRRLVSDVVTGQIDVRDVEVPEFEYITDEDDNASDDESIDTEETVDEEA